MSMSDDDLVVVVAFAIPAFSWAPIYVPMSEIQNSELYIKSCWILLSVMPLMLDAKISAMMKNRVP